MPFGNRRGDYGTFHACAVENLHVSSRTPEGSAVCAAFESCWPSRPWWATHSGTISHRKNCVADLVCAHLVIISVGNVRRFGAGVDFAKSFSKFMRLAVFEKFLRNLPLGAATATDVQNFGEI